MSTRVNIFLKQYFNTTCLFYWVAIITDKQWPDIEPFPGGIYSCQGLVLVTIVCSATQPSLEKKRKRGGGREEEGKNPFHLRAIDEASEINV